MPNKNSLNIGDWKRKLTVGREHTQQEKHHEQKFEEIDIDVCVTHKINIIRYNSYTTLLVSCIK